MSRQNYGISMDGFGDRALAVLAVIATIFLLHWGAPFFIPLIIAIIIAFALSPLVDALTRVLRWRVLSATVVVAAVLAALAAAAWSWRDDVERLWEQMPVVARAVADSVKKAARQPAGSMAEVTKAAAEIEAVAQTGKANPPPAKTAPAPSGKSFWAMVWEGGQTVITAAAQTLAVIFLVFFMLAAGDLFKRKIVKIAGTTLSEKKITVEVIDEIDRQIRRYLGVMLIANVLVGVGTWAVFKAMGLNYPELWGMAAAILHTAPYFGPAFIAIGTLFAGFLQFGSWSHAIGISAATIVVATLVGSVFQTWLASRESEMNTTATFVGLLFFGWIWGFWGVLLGIPLLAIVKTICDHNDDWKGVGELLSR
jgi:predicted PurR-regulated permease PerM